MLVGRFDVSTKSGETRPSAEFWDTRSQTTESRLTQRSSPAYWETDSSSAIQEIHFLTCKGSYRFPTNLPLDPSLSQINFTFKTHPNIILTLTPSFPSGFSDSSHPPWSDHPNSVSSEAPHCAFSPSSCHFLLLVSKYAPWHPAPNPLLLFVSFRCIQNSSE